MGSGTIHFRILTRSISLVHTDVNFFSYPAGIGEQSDFCAGYAICAKRRDDWLKNCNQTQQMNP